MIIIMTIMIIIMTIMIIKYNIREAHTTNVFFTGILRHITLPNYLKNLTS